MQWVLLSQDGKVDGFTFSAACEGGHAGLVAWLRKHMVQEGLGALGWNTRACR